MHYPIDLFSLDPRDKFWNISYLGDEMNGKRLKRIKECLKLDDNEEAPENRGRFFWTKKKTKTFNGNVSS